jgi:NADPH:quinone reductase-like Zn-dependent oxidoreductase
MRSSPNNAGSNPSSSWWIINTEDLEAVADLLDAQQLVVRIGQTLPPRDGRRAHEMLERLRPLPAGKVVLNAVGDS